MEQEKVGRLIAQCRKEKELTQAQVAERLRVSNRAVSKWETGKSCPDAPIMIELCDLLGITVNELLCGERVRDLKDYPKRAEDTMVEMQRQLASYKRRIRISNLFLLAVAVISIFASPAAFAAVVLIMGFRDYYLFSEMNALKQKINGCTKPVPDKMGKTEND